MTIKKAHCFFEQSGTLMDDKGRREGFCDEFPTRVHEDWRCYGEKIPFHPKQDF